MVEPETITGEKTHEEHYNHAHEGGMEGKEKP